MINNKTQTKYSNWQTFSLTFLRVLIGWHFLYEGLIKLYTPEWTSKGYLLEAVGPFASIFKGLTSNQVVLAVVDNLNIWGLIGIGLCLFVGFLAKPVKLFGIGLLLLYYFAYPPFIGVTTTAPLEGSYWIVNKNLIEIAALFVLYLFPSSQITGIDRFIKIRLRSAI
jgi:thiosulfate dehydrogenase [quinone] large subunit